MAASTITSSTDSIPSSQQAMLEAQQQAYLEQEKFQTESAIMQSKHDTMMDIIKSIAQ